MSTLTTLLPLYARPLRAALIAAAAYVTLQQVVYEFEIDDHLHALWKNYSTTDTVKRQSVWLPNYELTDRKALPFVKNNLSGITFNPDTGTLWTVINNPQQLLELDTEFKLLRSIELVNFTDTEAVAYAGNNRLVIADERDQSVVLAEIPDTETTSIDKFKENRLTLDTNGGGNKGFEGIAVDPYESVIYVVREQAPMTLLTITGLLSDDEGLTIANSSVIDASNLHLEDLSGLHYDNMSGNLLFLSHESKALAEISRDGSRISYLDLVEGFHGQKSDIPQAEGVTLGPDRSLFIVSEPNMIYRFDPGNRK